MIGASLPTASQARVQTPKARNYLVQLCKHFAHRNPATFAGNRGRIQFDGGACELDADDAGAPVLAVFASDVDKLTMLEDVVEQHLKRFAFKEELSVPWVRG